MQRATLDFCNFIRDPFAPHYEAFRAKDAHQPILSYLALIMGSDAQEAVGKNSEPSEAQLAQLLDTLDDWRRKYGAAMTVREQEGALLYLASTLANIRCLLCNSFFPTKTLHEQVNRVDPQEFARFQNLAREFGYVAPDRGHVSFEAIKQSAQTWGYYVPEDNPRYPESSPLFEECDCLRKQAESSPSDRKSFYENIRVFADCLREQFLGKSREYYAAYASRRRDIEMVRRHMPEHAQERVIERFR